MSSRTDKSDQDMMLLAQKAKALETASRYRELVKIGQRMLKLRPDWSLSQYFLGSGQCGMGLLDEADRTLRRAISLDDGKAAFYVRHAEVLNRLGHADEAWEQAKKAIRLAPDNPDVLVPAAMVRWLGGDARDAHKLLDEAIADGTESAKLLSVHALICAEVGRLDEGIATLRGILEEHNDGRGLPRLLHSECRMYLAKLLDRDGQYNKAFEQAKAGGALRETGYDPDEVSRVCDERLAAWSAERFDAIPCSRVNSEEPVFIIGMPRSGTSLVEQIIASHPLAYGSGELLDAWHAGTALSEPDEYVSDRVAKVDQLKPAALDRHARGVLKKMHKAARREKGRGVRRVTDKLPGNYAMVGIIHKMLPGARFIHCVRDPLDTCISCFMLDFVGDRNHGYSYDLEHLAHQYRVYERYIAHWSSIASIPILEVRYEELVEDPENGAKDILEFIGLEWDEACARPHETERAVSTLSSDQVRKPMYTSSKQRWRNYERHIEVLIDELGEEKD